MRVPGVYADPSLLADKAAAARRLAAILPGVDRTDLERRFEVGAAFRLDQASHHAGGTGGGPGPRPAGRRLQHRRAAGLSQGQSDQPRHRLRRCRRGRPRRHRALRAGPPERRWRAGQCSAWICASSRSCARSWPTPPGVQDDRRQRHGSGPVTGELLAMVSLPDFDPNRVGNAKGIEYLNRNTGEVYELGSVFKILTIAAALDSGQVSSARQVRRHRQAADRALPDRRRPRQEPLAFGAGDLRILVQHRHRAHGVRGGRRAAAGDLLPPGRLLRAARRSRSPRRSRSRTPKRWADVTVATGVRARHRRLRRCSSWMRSVAWCGDGTRVPPTLLKRAARGPLPRTRYVSSAHGGHDALADVAGGPARHRHARQARQLPDRRQDRHRREAEGRATARDRFWPRFSARSRSMRRATSCSCRSTSPRATPARTACAMAAGRPPRSPPRSSTGSARSWACHRRRPAWPSRCGPGWPRSSPWRGAVFRAGG